MVITIGNATPTGSGYYTQVDQNAPVIVQKYAIDDIFDAVQSAHSTPTPAPTQTQAPIQPTMLPSATPHTRMILGNQKKKGGSETRLSFSIVL